MSMWSLMASPLIFSGDMNYLDEFTLNVLCNSEVIEVDQDSLGRQARIVRHTESDFVLAKPMEDGSLAVGVFNIGEKQARIQVTWAELGLTGQRRVRDVWRQKDIGQASGQLSVEVNRHGVTLVRLFPR
jgi:alpha-galactosidase